MTRDWSSRAQKSSPDRQRDGESTTRISWPKIEGRIFREKVRWAQEGPRRAETAPDWLKRAKKNPADSQRAGESIGRIRWPKIKGRIFRENKAGAEGGPRRAEMAPDWSNRAKKKFCRLAERWRVDCARQMAKNRRPVLS